MQKSPHFFKQSEQALSHHSNKYQMITKCTIGYFLWLFWFVHVRASLLIKETLVHFTRLWYMYQYMSWYENFYLCWNKHFNVKFFMKPNYLVTNPRILFSMHCSIIHLAHLKKIYHDDCSDCEIYIWSADHFESFSSIFLHLRHS